MGGDTYLVQNLSLFGKIQMWYWKLVAGRCAGHLLSEVFGMKITELLTNEHPSGSARNLIILETFSSLSFCTHEKFLPDITLICNWQIWHFLASFILGKLQTVFVSFWKYHTFLIIQVIYVIAAMLGGFLSATSSDTLATTKGVPIPAALGGGFLLLIGARFAAGCTR